MGKKRPKRKASKEVVVFIETTSLKGNKQQQSFVRPTVDREALDGIGKDLDLDFVHLTCSSLSFYYFTRAGESKAAND